MVIFSLWKGILYYFSFRDFEFCLTYLFIYLFVVIIRHMGKIGVW